MGKTERLLILVSTIVAGLSGAVCAYIAVATYYGWGGLKMIPPAVGTNIAPSIGFHWHSVGWGVLALAFWAGSTLLILYGAKRGVWNWKRGIFIPLTKIVETLIDAGKQKQIIKGMSYLMEMRNDPDRYYEPFVKLIAQKTDIYRKRPSFDKYETISENMILMGDFSNLCSKLYLNKELLFTDLVIREIAFDKTIQEIMSSDRPFPWLNYEVM